MPESLEEIASCAVDVSVLTTWKVGGSARLLLTPRGGEDLRDILIRLHERQECFHVLGGGSNVLLADGEIAAPIVLTSGLISVSVERQDEIIVRCGAGVKLKDILALSIREGWSGMEHMAGIPGTIGGAVLGNAGTKHGNISNIVRSVDVFGKNGNCRSISGEDIEWGYRSTSLEGQGVLAEVALVLRPSSSEKVADAVRRGICDRKFQPSGALTAGCVFKNPKGDSAGRLIDAAGCKGLTVGGARVSRVHANFIENFDGACAADILSLVRECRGRVREKFGIGLQLEIKTIGFSREVLDEFLGLP